MECKDKCKMKENLININCKREFTFTNRKIREIMILTLPCYRHGDKTEDAT